MNSTPTKNQLTSFGTLPVNTVEWKPAVRIIPSRYPPINLFERVSDPDDLDAIIALESATNERLLNEIGRLDLVPREERVTGPGSGYVMAPFTHISPAGTRFSPAYAYGVYYCSRDESTAIAETIYHREQFMKATNAPPMDLDQRVLLANLKGDLCDLRGMREDLHSIYSPEHYAVSQKFGSEVRLSGADGIVYDSVRDTGGECSAIFKPKLLSRCRQGRHLVYRWDGQRVADVYVVKKLSSR